MRIHSVRSVQLNTARVVAILTPHLTTRAACILSRILCRCCVKGRVVLSRRRQRKHSHRFHVAPQSTNLLRYQPALEAASYSARPSHHGLAGVINISCRRRIEKVAVLGAGTMGARISAHLANAGVPSYLFDIVPPDADGPARNRIAAAGLEAAVKSKPAAFFKPSLARLVTIGNFEDDLHKLAEVDWIIEAVIEDLEIKRSSAAQDRRRFASPAPSSPPIPAVCRSRKSSKASPTTSAAPGLAPTSSIRRATCACWS